MPQLLASNEAEESCEFKNYGENMFCAVRLVRANIFNHCLFLILLNQGLSLFTKVWNALPDNIKTAQNTITFKNLVKSWFFGNKFACPFCGR